MSRASTPQGDWPDPFAARSPAIVFTGTMDYRPNIEAVKLLRQRSDAALGLAAPSPHFHIVGANPSPLPCGP